MNFQPPDTPDTACPETGHECDCNGNCNMITNLERETALRLAKESGHDIGIQFDYMGNAHYVPESLIKLINQTTAEALERVAIMLDRRAQQMGILRWGDPVLVKSLADEIRAMKV